MPRGTFIVIDGADATGKKTQTELLELRLKKAGVAAMHQSFPRYEQNSSYLVRLYLGREEHPPLGTPEDIGPYFASMFYAYDRRAASPEMRDALENGTWVICDRYVTANMGHQGGLIADAAERKAFYAWVREFEYGICKLPRPDMTLLMHVPLATATELLQRRLHQVQLLGGPAKQDTLDGKELQRKAHGAFEELAQWYPDEFTVISCTDEQGSLLQSAEIHERIWQRVAPLITRSY